MGSRHQASGIRHWALGAALLCGIFSPQHWGRVPTSWVAGAIPAYAQQPIIEEVRPPVKPKPKPKPTFNKPKFLWKTSLGKIEGTPGLAGDSVFLSASDTLYLLDTGGRAQWHFEADPQMAGPVFDEFRAYIGTDKGNLIAVNRKTGGEAWRFATDGGAALYNRPALGAGRVYAEATDGTIYAVDAVKGQLRWKFPCADGSFGYASPVFENGALVVCGETTLYRLNSQDGTEIWKSYLGGKSLSTPESGGGRLYVGGDGTGLVAVSPSNGSVLWTFTGKEEKDWFGTPLYVNGTVYVSTYNRWVYAVDAATGKQKWSYRVLGSALAAPALDAKRNVLYVTSTTYRDNPTLTAIDSKIGKKLWDYQLGSATGSPVIVADKLFVGSLTGSLFAFGLK